METASFVAGVQPQKYSEQQEKAPKKTKLENFFFE
jgi:hypothetical protein